MKTRYNVAAMKDLILQLVKEATQEISNATTPAQLEELRIKYLGRKGSFTNVMQNLKNVPNEEKPAIGQALNAAKNELEQYLTSKQKILEEEVLKQQLNDDSFDITRPGTHYETGHVHPLSQVQKEVEEIFSQMGFAIQDGPEIESEYYNSLKRRHKKSITQQLLHNLRSSELNIWNAKGRSRM